MSRMQLRANSGLDWTSALVTRDYGSTITDFGGIVEAFGKACEVVPDGAQQVATGELALLLAAHRVLQHMDDCRQRAVFVLEQGQHLVFWTIDHWPFT